MNKQKSQAGFAHLMILVIILVLALIGALGYIYWQNFINKDDNLSGKVSNAKTKDDSIVAVTDPVDNTDKYKGWQTYTNSTFNYSLQYPDQWVVSKYQDNPSKPENNYFQPSKDSKMGVDVQSWQSSLTPKEFADQAYMGKKILDSNEVSINGEKTYYYRSADESNSKNISQNYIISHAGQITSIAMTEKSDNGYYSEDNTTYVDQFKLIAKSIRFN